MLLDFAVARGADRELLLSRSGIAPEDLAADDDRIPLTRFRELTRAAQELCGDPALALKYGEAFDVSEVSIGCLVSGASATLAAAVEQMNHFARLGVDCGAARERSRFQLSREGAELWFIDNAVDLTFPELAEMSFARLVTSTRHVLGDVPVFLGVRFARVAPAYESEYARVFRTPVMFGSETNAVRIDQTVVASMWPSQPSELVSGVLRQHAERLLRQLDRSQSVRGRVEDVLVPLLKTGDTTVETVAREIGVSRQTLFRQLRAEGVTFEGILEELRCRLALRYLQKDRLSVSRVATMLGYSDATAFARAFRRWTGRAPRDARRPGGSNATDEGGAGRQP